MESTSRAIFPRSKKPAVRATTSGFFARLFSRFTRKKQYKNLQSIRSNQNSYYKPNLHRKSNFEKKDENFKVFKPSNDHLIKEKVKNSINFGAVKKFAFGQKNLDLIGRSTSLLDTKNWLKTLNFYVFKWQLIEKFNRLVALGLIITSLVGFAYISLFDRFFLVKTYAINFGSNSYLDQSQIDTLTKNIRQEKIFGLLPNNGYWFINDYTLTKSVQSQIPEVESVNVTNRIWPNKVELKITTQPILLTLGVIENTQKRYWRISQTGKVLTEDNLNLRENLVEIDRVISFDKPGSSLKDYALEENSAQLNRFWFVIWLWSALKDQGIIVSKTTFPSLLDSDVEITTNKNVRLLFDSAAITKENQLKRIKSVLDTMSGGKTIRSKLEEGQLNYIDFRIPKRVFLCDLGKNCTSEE
jgi:hypothetical protein